jgi:glyoxylase-like metal-dependent hydrolase (beta-lactamase superfamily II)
MTNIPFYRDFEFQYGVLETVSPLIRRIVARNPGAFTGPGTGTYVVGHGHVAVIDPGPSLSGHVDALLHSLRGETIEHILITHTHPDHWPAADAVQRASGAKIYGLHMDETMRDGDVLSGSGWRLTAVHTPGHASDHLSFSLDEERTLFTGDHVMGWSTSVIIPPDGDMGTYVNSLAKLLHRNDEIYLPTHGPAILEPKPYVRSFIEHRRERTAAILRRLDAGDATIHEIVEAVYVDVPQGLHGAAGLSVLAHLIELVGLGKVACDGPPSMDLRYRRVRGTKAGKPRAPAADSGHGLL